MELVVFEKNEVCWFIIFFYKLSFVEVVKKGKFFYIIDWVCVGDVVFGFICNIIVMVVFV